jgi:hypothetical protein
LASFPQAGNPGFDRANHLRKLLGNSFVRESENGEAEGFEVLRSDCLIPELMRRIVDLDHQFRIEAAEVGDPVSAGDLTAKAYSERLPLQPGPDSRLRDCELSPQCPCPTTGDWRICRSRHLVIVMGGRDRIGVELRREKFPPPRLRRYSPCGGRNSPSPAAAVLPPAGGETSATSSAAAESPVLESRSCPISSLFSRRASSRLGSALVCWR